MRPCHDRRLGVPYTAASDIAGMDCAPLAHTNRETFMPWYNLILTPAARKFVLVVIIINAVTLGLETSPTITAAVGPILTLLDNLALAVFTAELIMKMLALRSGFVRDPWNIFDFVVVAIAFVPAAGSLTVLRSMRVFRVLRLISSLSRLRTIVQALVLSLPSIGWITLLMIVVFYIFSVMATNLFGAAFPQWFGSLSETFFTLFQVMTLESWAMGVARPVMDAFPYAWLFFVPFVLLSSFVVLNVFIAIIVNGMDQARAEEETRTSADTDTAEPDLEAELACLRAQLDKVERLIRRRNAGSEK